MQNDVKITVTLSAGDYESLVNIESRAKQLDITNIISHIISEYECKVNQLEANYVTN